MKRRSQCAEECDPSAASPPEVGPEAHGQVLDEHSVLSLRRFFELLDKWDKERL